jgi:hypothetical protein
MLVLEQPVCRGGERITTLPIILRVDARQTLGERLGYLLPLGLVIPAQFDQRPDVVDTRLIARPYLIRSLAADYVPSEDGEVSTHQVPALVTHEDDRVGLLVSGFPLVLGLVVHEPRRFVQGHLTTSAA